MANLLKIATTITETKYVNKDIDLPYYFKIDSYLYKVVTTEHLVRVETDTNWWGARVFPVPSYKAEIAKGTPITAEEFEAAYSNALMYLEAIYRNENGLTEHDENQEIDQILERRAS